MLYYLPITHSHRDIGKHMTYPWARRSAYTDYRSVDKCSLLGGREQARVGVVCERDVQSLTVVGIGIAVGVAFANVRAAVLDDVVPG